MAEGKQKSPNFAMLSQKFAILDTKFVNIREASFACCKRKTKITEFRDVVSRIRDSGYKIRDVREVGFACGKKKTKITEFHYTVSKIRDQHVGPAYFLVQQCQPPISTVLLLKLFNIHRATKAFGTTTTSTNFRNICQKKSPNRTAKS